VQGPHQPERHAPPKPVAEGVLVLDRILVVVIPGADDAAPQQRRGHAVLPPRGGGRVRKVEVRAVRVPKHGPLGRVRRCRRRGGPKHRARGGRRTRRRRGGRARGADEEGRRSAGGVLGVVDQEAGLDVGGEAHASGGISGGEPVRVGHLAAVPREDVPAAGGGRGVAAGELEGGERHLPRRALGEKGLELPLGVGRIGEGHRRARVAERPARRQQRLAGQPREAGRHAAYPRPEQHVVVEVAALGLVAREEAVVVVELAPKVERRPRHRVVKDTVRAAPPARDRAQRRRLAVPVRTERLRRLPRPGRVGGARARLADVKGVKLVERIAPLGVVPHGVDAAQVESPARAVESSAALAAPKVGVASPAGDVVRDSAVGADVVRTRRAIAQQELPITSRLVMPRPCQPERLAHGSTHRDTQAAGRQANGAIDGTLERGVGHRKAFGALLGPTFLGERRHSGSDHPRTV